MTQEEIIAGNKMIAKFMGIDFETEDSYLTYPPPMCRNYGNYHHSWDWLMPVYLKIVNGELYEPKDDTFEESKEEAYVLFNVMYDRLADGDGIEAVWESIIEFLKWYNKEHAI